MNIDLNKAERKEFIEKVIDDEIVCLARKLFKDKYEEILSREIQIKIERFVDNNGAIFEQVFRDRTKSLIDDNIRNTFGKKGEGDYGTGYSCSFHGLKMNPEVVDKIIDKMYKKIELDFDMKEFETKVKTEVISKLTNNIGE